MYETTFLNTLPFTAKAPGPRLKPATSIRHWGPTTARFDHHLGDADGHPCQQVRGVMYAAARAQTCLAEVFQHTRVVNVRARLPYLAIWRTTAPLDLLDLTGVFITRMGASTAIHSGHRGRARQWAVALYEAWPELDGIAYCSSMDGNAEAFALNERSVAAFPKAPESLRMLGDLLIADVIDAAAQQVGYVVAR